MDKVNISDIYACIHTALRTDPEVLTLLRCVSNASLEELATRIQKRKKPQELVQNNLPMISFYKKRGHRGDNYLEYRFSVDFDIYTQDNVELALNIADRIAQLFDDKIMSGLRKGSMFKGTYVTSAEGDTDLENMYKYFIQIEITIWIDEN